MYHLALTLLLQSAPVDPQGASLPDSARLRRDAVGAQGDFEIQRRRRLPVTWGGYSGRCDVRVGRFCYWHDDESPQGPKEPASIAPLRQALLVRLGEAAKWLPGDGWIVGQQVRYLLEAERAGEALDAAERCRAEAWWCRALEGLVLHTQRAYAEADSSFSAALLVMPDELRCRWENIADLLPPTAARVYRGRSCAERRSWADTTWALADPLWSVPGNDRRTEHYARHVMSHLERHSRSTYQMSWAEDTHELLVRFGWPERWSRRDQSALSPSEVSVIGHEAHPAFDFWPVDDALGDARRLSNEAYRFSVPEAASRYSPAYAKVVKAVPAQVTRFLRGDSMEVVAAWRPPADTTFERASLSAALAVRGFSGAQRVAVSSDHVLRVRATRDSGWTSLEVSAPETKGLARYRAALPRPDSAELGLLLYSDPSPTDGTLDDVISRALPSLETSRRDRLGIYWEYPAARDSVTFVLSVYPRSAHWLTRLARSMRLAEAAAPVHVRLTEPAGARTSRSLGVDVSHLAPGTYDVRVRVETGAVELGQATRTVVLKR